MQRDPVANLQGQGEAPFSTVKELVPEQLASIEPGVRFSVLFNVRGPLSRLDIDSEVKIRYSTYPSQSPCMPADIFLKAQVQHREHIQLEVVSISSPWGTLSMKGTVGNYLSDGRKGL